MTEPAGHAADLLASGLAAIDEVNSHDPVQVLINGVSRPKEVVHAERMTYWLGVLAPDASAAQQLAARANHLRRWVSPRADYPGGRAAYLRWRADHKKRQAAEVAEILQRVGYDETTIERVSVIVAKVNLAGDPEVQTHEDALCLVFLESQLDDVSAQLGDEHMVKVLRRTAAKMSHAGLAAASGIALSEHGRTLLAAALDTPADTENMKAKIRRAGSSSRPGQR